MIRTHGLFRYVPHVLVDVFHERGWFAIEDLGPVHGFWSVLMWHCDPRDCDCGVKP